MTRTLRSLTVCALAALSLTLAACGGSDAPAATSTPTPAATSTSTADVSTAAASTTTASSTGKVSANNASAEDLTAAFEAANVPSADRWAREVEEYRPYATDDPTFAKLRQNLAKYNPSPDVVTAIIGTLALD